LHGILPGDSSYLDHAALREPQPQPLDGPAAPLGRREGHHSSTVSSSGATRVTPLGSSISRSTSTEAARARAAEASPSCRFTGRSPVRKRGYLPIMSGCAIAESLQAKGVHRWGLKTFLLTQASKARSLDALACVDDPTPAIRELDAITRAVTTPNGRTARPFNPLSRDDRTLFEVLLAGEHALHGFTNRDLRAKLGRTPFSLANDSDKQPGQLTRLLRRLHAHGLIAKVPRSRRWRVSLGGRRLMASAIKLREVAFPSSSPRPLDLGACLQDAKK